MYCTWESLDDVSFVSLGLPDIVQIDLRQEWPMQCKNGPLIQAFADGLNRASVCT